MTIPEAVQKLVLQADFRQARLDAATAYNLGGTHRKALAARLTAESHLAHYSLNLGDVP